MIENKDKEFLRQNPDLATIDLLLVDANGQIRGKRIDASAIEKVFNNGIPLPASIFGSRLS